MRCRLLPIVALARALPCHGTTVRPHGLTRAQVFGDALQHLPGQLDAMQDR
jgi:hypothetical protein